MRTTATVDLIEQQQRLAGRMGVDTLLLVTTLTGTNRLFWSSPGDITRDEKPLGVGTLFNLRRGFPSGKHPDDQGWYVAAYTRKRDGRWTGYILVRVGPDGQLKANSMSNAEAIDLVEAFDVMAGEKHG